VRKGESEASGGFDEALFKMKREDEDTPRKYVFICGLQRSGTSVLARNVGRLEGCTSFKNTGVLQDEGQYLQDVYPPDGAYGGTGWYGLDPRAHLTEQSPLLTPDNIERLMRSWHAHWDDAKPICVEKTPGNLIMTRFLQAAFPNTYFIVVKRHPVAVSMATQRWKVSLSSLHHLFKHWLRCYDLFEQDKAHLSRVFELRYEDYISDPTTYHARIADFIGTRVPAEGMEDVTDVHNKKYLARWEELLNVSRFRKYYRYVAARFEPEFARHGYSLVSSAMFGGERQNIRAWHSPMGALYSLGADSSAFVCRAALRSQWFAKRQLRGCLPARMKTTLKQIGMAGGNTAASQGGHPR